MSNKVLLSGNEAAARGAWEAGVKVATAYPGTPSTEILENLVRYDEVYAEWSTNEKVALEVALGAAIAGARSMTSMKHVGLNVAADPMFTSAYTGINAGFVIVTCDDPGMHSSQNEQDNRRYAKFAKLPLVEPSDSQESKDYLKEAFNISEMFDTPVLFRMTTRISHSKTMVELGERKEVGIKDYVKNFRKFVTLPANAKARHYVVEERLKKLKEFSSTSPLNRIEEGDRSLGIVTSGISYQYAKEVFPHATFLKLGMAFPFPEDLFKKFASMVQRVIVIEENEPFLEEEIKTLGYTEVEGKKYIPFCDELSPEVVRKGVLNEELPHPEPIKSVMRPPVFCAGCPHTGVFYNLWRLKATVTGDIGCYTLGALAPYESIDTTICMGAGITNAFGFQLARGKEFSKKVFGVVGDSTFLHSGITGLIDIVYNKGITKIIILDNRITAMTGHQDHPGTGKTAKGEVTKAVNFKDIVKACGIEKVYEVDPHELRATREVLKEVMELDEPAVIISRRACALLPEERKKQAERPKRKVNVDICKGEKCLGCVKLGCPAISIKNGKASISDLLCVGCDLCIQVCPFKAIS
ncbi:MAG TPA: indolepyruvate ferredoxin oxidoreductase subunit alpha [Candidatus Hydrothermia bacterium]|nr:indolepyruvate ferredoxin oxidoreductase subunit alpha [Candidatus Hydrothermia bacterium]